MTHFTWKEILQLDLKVNKSKKKKKKKTHLVSKLYILQKVAHFTWIHPIGVYQIKSNTGVQRQLKRR